jgi:hypothetical protein
MSLTWGQVKRWRAAPFTTAEEALTTARRDLLDRADDLRTMAGPPRWVGSAATTAQHRLTRVTDDLEILVAEVSAARRAVIEAGDAVTGVELAVDAAVEYANQHGLAISADGTVTDDTGLLACYATEHDEEVARQERQVKVDECVGRVEQALRKANDVDADLVAVLSSIRDGTVADGSDTSLDEAARDGDEAGRLSLLGPPSAGTPADNTGWWESLSPDEQQRVLDEHPDWVGNLDGIPMDVRDEANRTRLADADAGLTDRRDDLREQLDAMDPDPYDPAYLRLIDELGTVEEQLAAVDTLQGILEDDDRHLLVFDLPEGKRPEAAVSVGDVDTADHVGVFTPGLTSTVEGMGGYVDDMADLRRASLDELRRNGDMDGTVATVVWLDYQAPQWGSTFSGDSVALSGSAEDGGAALADFYRGLNSSRATDPDLTALGHSYGSTTTGYGLQHEGTGVDRAVFFGSPGLGTSDVDDLDIPSGNAYYAEAKWDGVGDLGRFGIDPSAMDGINHLETGDATVDGRDYDGVSGHSSYLQAESTSQYNMATVVSGHPQDAIEGNNTGITDDPRAWDWWPSWLGG